MKLTPLFLTAALATLLAGCQNTTNTASAPDPDEPKTESGSTTGAEPAKKEVPPIERKPADGEEVAVLDTTKGRIVVMFFPDKAPEHVKRFKMLAEKKFYDGTRFHRCMPGFMIQGGDPFSRDLSLSSRWGTGNYVENGQPSYLVAEFNDIPHVRGVLSAARSQDPNSASSQFFLMHGQADSLNGQYSAYGMAVSGLDVIDKIVATGPSDPALNGAVEPKNAVVLKSVRIAKWPVKD